MPRGHHVDARHAQRAPLADPVAGLIPINTQSRQALQVGANRGGYA
jgi:hypothetical protein